MRQMTYVHCATYARSSATPNVRGYCAFFSRFRASYFITSENKVEVAHPIKAPSGSHHRPLLGDSFGSAVALDLFHEADPVGRL